MAVDWIRVGEMEDTHTPFGDRNDRTCYDELDDKRWGNEGKRGIEDNFWVFALATGSIMLRILRWGTLGEKYFQGQKKQ